MSPRAAWRLETIGFTEVHDYFAGKADWGSSGLPLEGTRGSDTRVGADVRRDVPTCRLDERLAEVRARVGAAGWDTCFVVNEEKVVLGRLGPAALARENDVSVEQAMSAGPSTVRPSLELAVERMRRQNLTTLPVTTSEGRLLGLLERDTAEQALRELNRNSAVRFPRALSRESRRLEGSRISSVPISIALVAGGLAVVNPCGFPLLPAFLSFYLGADERRLPPAPTRVLQGLLVGALVTVGFLGFFALVGLPVSYGVGAIARAVPWAGLVTGAALALAGVLTLLGEQLRLPTHLSVRPRRERRLGAMLLFGVGYGAASLGCTLPLFLTLVGASLSGGGKLTAFVAYGAGMAVVLMALSVLVALAREGAARAVRPLLPYMNRLAGLLLLASGGYLFYYWARLRFGDTATVADDPIVSFGVRFSGRARNFADSNGELILVAAVIVALAVFASLWQRRRRAISARLVRQ